MKFISAAEAVACIKSHEKVFIHGGAATPQILVNALTERHKELEHVELVHLHTEGSAPYAELIYSHSFLVNCLFVAGNVRKHINQDNVQYVPVFLSEVPLLFRKKIIPLDVAMIQVSVPDRHGYCSLGVSVDVTRAATDMAKTIIALVNPRMPRSHGDGLIHMSRFTHLVYHETEIAEVPPAPVTDVERRIGEHVAGIIEDGATLQMGIGGIPNAVLLALGDHKNLGVHTEMFSDGVLPLVESGVINNSLKRKHVGKIVSSFAMGTRKLYDFIHDNPSVAMLDVSYVNDTAVIRKNPKMTAINSALEIDLTGQVCADSLGTRIYSGVGGQMDFIRGASLAERGKPIIALPSITAKGESKIVPTLKPGAGVVTTRAHVHYIVTEYGVADLYGKNIVQRAEALINIAHPNHREALSRQAHEMYGRGW